MAKNPRLIDLSGQKFGRWTVIEQAGNSPRGAALWLSLCICGATGHPSGTDLRSGKSTSCGCASVEKATARVRTHGDSGTRLHRIWKNIRARCLRETHPQFPDYGGRGVAICPEWSDFGTFRDWALLNGYADNLSIERSDVDGDYTPGNCIWANATTQSRNRRFVARAPDGTPWCEIAARNGITATQYNGRVHEGWTREQAATLPVGTRIAPPRERDKKGRWA